MNSSVQCRTFRGFPALWNGSSEWAKKVADHKTNRAVEVLERGAVETAGIDFATGNYPNGCWTKNYRIASSVGLIARRKCEVEIDVVCVFICSYINVWYWIELGKSRVTSKLFANVSEVRAIECWGISKYEVQRRQNEILRNIYSSLVLASRIDWARKDRIREMMLCVEDAPGVPEKELDNV